MPWATHRSAGQAQIRLESNEEAQEEVAVSFLAGAAKRLLRSHQSTREGLRLVVNSCQPDIRALTAPARDRNCEVFQPEASFLCSDQVSRSGRSRGYSEGDCHAPVPFVSLGAVGGPYSGKADCDQ